MTPTQKDMHLYIAGVLATNERCWISVSELARRIGRSRRGCQKAAETGAAFFKRDDYDRAADPDAKRLWTLAMPMPSKQELARFLPRRKARGEKLSPSHGKDGNGVNTHLRTELAEGGANEVPQSVNTAPSVRCLGRTERVSGGGGGEATTTTAHTVSSRNDDGTGQAGEAPSPPMADQPCSPSSRPVPTPGQPGYRRHAAARLLGLIVCAAETGAKPWAKRQGVSPDSREWNSMFPNGRAVYEPNDRDEAVMLDLIDEMLDAGMADPVAFGEERLSGWLEPQLHWAIESARPVRDCVRASSFADYLRRCARGESRTP
jgi:hypothetical protein